MPQMTVEQADALADQALALKIAVGDFRDRFFDTLTPEQREGLRNLAIELGNEVNHLTAVAIRLTLAELQGTLSRLQDVTDGVNQAVSHLSEVRKVITIATSLVSLGAAIASADPAGVLSAIEDTATSFRA